MMRTLVDYVTALAVCMAAAALYQLAVVPALTPPEVALMPIRRSTADVGTADLSGLFPEGAWQRAECRRLHTGDGLLLFTHSERISGDDAAGDRWRLRPVTVVLSKDDGPPIVLEAADGAEIKFAEALDVLSSGAPPIESGWLRGKVTIRSVPGAGENPAEAKDLLEIQAQDVGIDSRRIWTNEAIRGRWGDARIAGRNLTIRLAGGGTIPTGGGQSPLSLLDSMELIYLDELTIPLPAGGLWDSSAAAVPHALPAVASTQDPAPPAMASVRCGGRVTFDFASDTLRLRDQVQIQHRAARMPPDEIRCETLTLEFNSPLADGVPRTTPLDWLRLIEATGAPVTVNLPSLGAEAAAETISFDARTTTLRMGGGGGVRISYGGAAFRCTEFAYQMNAADPTRLGSLDAAGSGLADFAARQGVPVRRVQWNRGLKMQPTDDHGGYGLWVDGAVKATMIDGGSLAAESLLFTFRQLAAAAGDQRHQDTTAEAATPAKASDPSASSASSAALTQLLPEQARASGRVVLRTSSLDADTELLHLFFETQPAAAAATPAEPGLQLNPARGKPLRFWVGPPSGKERATVDPVSRLRPSLRGRSIQAKVRLSDGQVVGGDLSVDGDVQMTHQMSTPGGTLPLTVSGQQLRVVHGGDDDVIQISGGSSPARFELGDGFFVGPLIQVRSSDNVVWIDKAGSFQMPTAVLPRGDAKAAIRWAAAPRCDWSGEMVFDGRTAVLTQGVRIAAEMLVGKDAQPWHMAMAGDRLEITLDQNVPISDPARVRQAAIKDVSLVAAAGQSVFLTADRVGADGKLAARHVLSTPRLSLAPQTGRLHGDGPGWYRQWSKAEAGGPLQSMTPTGSLVGTHLIYSESIEGNLQQQQLDFNRGVRVGFSSVASWGETFDAATMNGLRDGQATIDCDRLRFSQAPGSGGSGVASAMAAWEMEALGGVVFRGRRPQGLFEGTAHRAAYAAAKDLFLIEGDGRRSAQFRHTQPTGQVGMTLGVYLLTLRPQTMEVVDMQLDQLSASPPANFQPR